jgi:hypothetical protein
LTVTIKLIIVAFSRDKASAKMWLDIKGHAGYCSCISCLIIGRISSKNNTTVCFPQSGFDNKVARRTLEWNKECERHREQFKLEDFGGHHSISVVTKLGQFDCWSISTHCPMHCIPEGVEQDEFFMIPLINRQSIIKLSERVKYTKETNSGFSNLKFITSFGASDWLTMLLFSLGPLMHEAGVPELQIIKISILASFYETLNSKTTPISINKLQEMHQLIMKYVASSIDPTPKMHSLLHMVADVFHLGLFWNYNSFATESLLKIFKKVTSESKTNLSNACRNFFEQSSVINLFSHFSIDLLGAFKVSEQDIQLCKDYIFPRKKETRNETKLITIIVNRREKRINSLQRTYKIINGTEIMITTDSYSQTKNTNNQFVIMEDNSGNFFARIMAISENFEIYFQRATIITTEEYKKVSLGRTEIVNFENEIELIPWINLVDKVIGFEVLNGKFYITKIK